LDNRIEQKYFALLNNTFHFIQIHRDFGETLIDHIAKTKVIPVSEMVVLSIEIRDRDFVDNLAVIIDFIEKEHSKNRQVAVRISLGTKIVFIELLLKRLLPGDYLFIDMHEDPFPSAVFYLKRAYSLDHECHMIAISNERIPKMSGREFADGDFNPLLNTSLVQAIKDNRFQLDGFGTYCSAKNDLTESQPNKRPVYAVFLLYNYAMNQYYSIKSDCLDHISRIYGTLRPKLIKQLPVIKTKFFVNTPISRKELEDFLLSNKKGNASTYIFFSITHYIEEIIYNIGL
jgi:hypothetical protein